jgi:hypothetical protein
MQPFTTAIATVCLDIDFIALKCLVQRRWNPSTTKLACHKVKTMKNQISSTSASWDPSILG